MTRQRLQKIEFKAMECYRKGMDEEQAFEFLCDWFDAEPEEETEIESIVSGVYDEYIDEYIPEEDSEFHSQTIEDKLREVGMSWRDFL